MSLLGFDPNKYKTASTAQPKPNEQGRFGDVVDSFQAGAASGLGGIFDFLGAEGIAKSLYGIADDQYGQMSSRGQEAMGKQMFQTNEQGETELGDGMTDLDTWLLQMANVAGQFVPTAVPGAGAAGLATKALSLGSTGAKVAQAVGMGATGGSAATGQAMEQARQEVLTMPDQVLAESDLFKRTFLEIDAQSPELDDLGKWNQAKNQLAERVASEVRSDPKALLANFAASAIGDPIIGRALTGVRLAKSGAFRSALAGGVTEGATEATQAGVSQYAVDSALSQIDQRDPMAGVKLAALNEGIIGAGFGAGAGGIGGLANRNVADRKPVKNAAADPIRETNPTVAGAMDADAQQAADRRADIDNMAQAQPSQQPNYDQPTAARRAGMGDTMQAGSYGDEAIARDNAMKGRSFPTVPEQFNQSPLTQAMDSVQGLTDQRREGEWLPPESQGRSPVTGLLRGPSIDSETLNAQRTREAMAAQPANLISQSDTIFASDGRARQDAQQFADTTARQTAAQPKQITDKGIIFAPDESAQGVTVKASGLPFASAKEALISKGARAAKREGAEVEAVKLDKGFGWRVIPKVEPETTEGTTNAPSLKSEQWEALRGGATIDVYDVNQIRTDQKNAVDNGFGIYITEHPNTAELYANKSQGTVQNLIINTPKSTLLNRDKTLAEQSEYIKSVLDKEGLLAGNEGRTGAWLYDYIKPKGEVKLSRNAGATTSKAASEKLLSIGIRGMTYNSNHGAGEGTHHVLFNGADITNKPNINAESKSTLVKEKPFTNEVSPNTPSSPITNAEPAQDLAGDKIDNEWTAFAPETGTLNIPRSEMPQIKAEHRGAMVNFMKARGVDHTTEEVPADSLKPTQAEFSPAKVKKALGFDGGDRSILVSSDNHVLDGHHQWLTKREKGEPIKVIRLNAPIKELINLAHEFPSSQTQAGATPTVNKIESTPITTGTRFKVVGRDFGNFAEGSTLLINGDADIDGQVSVSAIRSDGSVITGGKVSESRLKELVSRGGRLELVDQAPTKTNSKPAPEFELTEPSAPITDFGEKIGGARKDVWGGFSEAIKDQQNTKELPLSKSWPEPDYQELADNGSDREALALIAAMRAQIPPKPRMTFKVDRWVNNVNELKTMALSLIDGSLTVDQVKKAMSTKSNDLSGIANAAPVLAKADLSLLKGVANYRIQSGRFTVFGGKEYPQGKNLYFITRDGRTMYDGASETLSEVQVLLSKIITADQEGGAAGPKAKQSKIDVYTDRYTKQAFLGWKGAKGVLRIKTFESVPAARDYLKQNRDEVESTLARMKETPNERRVENAARIGPERFAGNVTPAIFADTFGFRGVEFGNYVEQVKRQKDLNQAYDALMDLAEVIDIPPKAISLNGELGLAFGARGKGGSLGGGLTAAAHYEPGNIVINLTKKAGAGSLAHEWYHALDNYFSRKRGDASSFISERPYPLMNKGVRDEVLEAFKGIKKAIHQSELVSRAKALDSRRSTAYWSTDIELGARAFESFVIAELERKGMTNDYLANIVSQEYWDAAEALGLEDGSTYPYPNQIEASSINAAYQSLFETIDVREGDSGNIELFSKASKGANRGARLFTQAEAQRAVDDVMKKLHGGAGIRVNLFTSQSEFLKRFNVNIGDMDNQSIYGAYDDKRNSAYLILDNFSSIDELRSTLVHEVLAHGGLHTVIGAQKYQQFIDKLNTSRSRKEFKDLWAKIDNDYTGASDRVKAEEVFANFVQNQPERGTAKAWWFELTKWLRRQLEGFGIIKSNITRNEMEDMMAAIVRGFKNRQSRMDRANKVLDARDEAPTDIRFSKTTTAPDERTAKQKLGLEEEAEQTLKDKITENYRNTADTLKQSSFWSRLNEGIFDGLHGIKKAEEAAGITDPNKMGYVSARLASGLSDVLHGVFHYGAPMWKDGIIQRKADTKGLLEVFGMLPDGELNNWLAWMGANRAKQLKAQGRENNLSQADIDELLALADGKEKLFEEVRAEYNKINSAVLDVAQGAGLISAEQRAGFDEQYYVPFFREQDVDPEMQDIASMVTAPFSKKGIAGQSAKIKELKGGKQSTKDLLENIILRQSTMLDAALKNKAMLEVADNLDGTQFMTQVDSPEFAKLSQRELNSIQRVKVMRDGQAVAYAVTDPALLRGLIAVNDVGSQALFNRMGRSAKRFLTAGVTLSPDFIFKNFIRDAAHAWMINKDDFKLGTDSIKGLKKAFKEDEAYRDLIFSGAAFQGGYVHGADPEAAAQQIRRALAKKGLTAKQIDGYMGSLVTNGKMLLEKYRNASDKVENANRLSTYEASLAAGKSRRQSAFEAKDLMDYSLKGNFALISTMIDFLPFFNARLQGMYKLARASAAGENDKVLKVLSANLAMKGIKVAAFSLALAAMNDDDDRYKELPDWDKDANWHFWLGDDHFRIPKPFELGVVFGTMPERLFGFGTGSQTGSDLGRAVANAVFNTMALNPIPQIALPVVEVMTNKSFFKGTAIEGMGDEQRMPGDRYNAYTSDTAREVGQLLNVSPKKIEHLVNGYAGTLGGYVLAMSDMMARQMLGKEKPETPISRYPVIKAFYGGGAPKGNTYYQNEFYKALDAANQAYGSYKRAAEEQDSSRMMAVLDDNRDKLGVRIALNRVQRQVSALSKQTEMVNNSSMSASEKREKLDAITRQKNSIYQSAYIGFNLREW
ncbi:LPD38 domain-containing protein [Shewanella putrefaciens]|uniref:LPD38 domain-containing protein n=1 Tax=Shewanella putrefaciens TaxID=24 RepID=UPI003D79FF0E